MRELIKAARAEIFRLALKSPDLETMHWYISLDECFENDEFDTEDFGKLRWRIEVLHEKEEPVTPLKPTRFKRSGKPLNRGTKPMRRRTTLKSNPDLHDWVGMAEAIYPRAKGRCERCGTRIRKDDITKANIHHILPRSRGGILHLQRHRCCGYVAVQNSRNHYIFMLLDETFCIFFRLMLHLNQVGSQ